MIKVVIAKEAKEIMDNFKLRETIFIKGQNVPVEIELDGLDDYATLLVAYDGDLPIGCGRYRLINNYAKIERIGVLDLYRGKGIGNLIMEKIENELANNTNVELLKLNSQCHAKEFYKKLGYKEKGEIFDEAGIDHIQMIKAI